jgi:hypothetical protein
VTEVLEISINGGSRTINPYRGCDALEGVVRQRVPRSARLRLIPTVMHFGSGLAKLLGFDLYTRWHDMRGQWLHVPRDWPLVPGLEPVRFASIAGADGKKKS